MMMATERWQQIKEIFHSALERAPAERTAFLDRTCAGDEAIRSEVESLIAAHEKEGSFIDSPAYEVAASWLAEDDEPDSLVGQQINHYHVLSELGAGGMGEVYLAQDTKLGRKIALKLLPISFTHDADRLHRFQQEARTASALNHPNILTIYEIGDEQGRPFIATELIEGQTLRERLLSGPLKFVDALDIILQVASALVAAHEVGIMHRDVKPENVMLRKDGYVKVLDFGLAKLAERKTGRAGELEALTRMRGNTSPGMVMGTVNYMSPEQARGLEVDERTDIWSLGVVMYEMLAGSPPFKGETPTDVTVAILEREPASLAALSDDIPAELDWIVKKALRKDREERYQTVREMLGDLRGVKQQLDFEVRLEKSATPQSRQSASAVISPQSHKRIEDEATRTDEIREARATTTIKPALIPPQGNTRWPLIALGVFILVTVATFGIYKLVSRSQSQNASAEKNNVTDAPSIANISRVTVWSGLDTQPTLSPDGNSVAYSSNHNGSFEIYVKQLTPGGREIQLTSDGQENFQPAWSPDGQHIAYYSEKRVGIWVVPALGGASRQLTEFGSAPAWSHDSTMLAFQSDSNPDLGSGSVGSSTIWIVPAQGGAPVQITKVGNPAGGHVGPTWSPDNRKIAFVALNYSNQEVWSISVTGDDLKQMIHTGSRSTYPLYSPDGRSLYFVSGPIVSRLPISSESGEAISNPVQVTDAGASIITNLTLSADGKRMAYGVQTLTSNIWSLPVSPNTNEATGSPQPLTNQTGTRNNSPAFSPDGRKIAFIEFLRGGGTHIWVADTDGKNPVQITTNPRNLTPSWFPDGDHLAFVSKHDNHWSVWATSLQSRRERPLFDVGRDIQYTRLSPDGRTLAFNLADERGIINLWTVPVSGGQPKQLTFDQELAGFPCWTPDGKFIAYQMKRGDDAYLMLMPSDGGEPTQLTFDHGRSWPHSFSPDGDKIVFAGERDGVWNVWWYSRSTKQQKQLTNYTKLNSFVRYPAASPLGNQIAYEYAETNGNIWIMDLK
jgi:Tol biopolymer transport system component